MPPCTLTRTLRPFTQILFSSKFIPNGLSVIPTVDVFDTEDPPLPSHATKAVAITVRSANLEIVFMINPYNTIEIRIIDPCLLSSTQPE